MLYQIYEAQRSITEPFADFAKAASKLFANPSWPLSDTPLALRISAAYDLIYRLGKDYEKPAFGIETVSVDGVDVTIHERVEMERPFCELRRFKRFSDNTQTLEALLEQPVVLIVAPLSGHYATLLRETVRTMLSGHKVYITDWKNARMVPLSEGDFHLDDYVNDVQDFIRYLQEKYGHCHVISVCQPTVPVLAAISLMASRGEQTPLTMTMMGGPIDARKSPTSVNNLAVTRSFEWFENNLIYRVPYGFPGEGREVYPGFLQYTGFVAMNPDRHASSYYDYFRNLIKGDDDATDHHRKFYDEYNAVLDMDANYYLETIQTVFQDYKLVKGTWDVKNPAGQPERVKPADIRTTALITVEGELDDISGSGQTRAAHTLCKNIPDDMRAHVEVAGAGHYGIFSGSRWRKLVYPQIRDFILRFQPRAAAPQVTAAVTSDDAEPFQASAPASATPAAPSAAEPPTAPATSAAQPAPAVAASVQPQTAELFPASTTSAVPASVPAPSAPAKAKRSRPSPKTAVKAASNAAPAPAATPAAKARRPAKASAAVVKKAASGDSPDTSQAPQTSQASNVVALPPGKPQAPTANAGADATPTAAPAGRKTATKTTSRTTPRQPARRAVAPKARASTKPASPDQSNAA
ncbi:polyhydroxyalkanoate depolymerase [Corticibacter populi]|uniref:Polyhydroxyalkanoate depolymerase n=1 Tax=Corticibacter populi TaxID=1550736 RepID=A0A3M6QSC2_9BURK|nr:polyhydroxyalkanoate depolymerase [Corticibacter populi]RMX05926.1 polyhydroxyalkanoate depolymerase [Corticibacter populi]